MALRGGAVPLELVAVDAARDGVAVEEVAAVFLGEFVVGVIGDAGDGAGAVVVVGDARGEAEAVVLFADAFVVAAAQEHVDWLGVAVGAEEIAERIEGEAEGVGLAVGVDFEVASRRGGSGRCCRCRA